MTTPPRYFLLFCFFAVGHLGFSQALPDTSFVAVASANAVKSYHEFIRGQSGVYTGSEYRYEDRTNDDHPFYGEFDWVPGTINYEGEIYEGISFLYDLTADVLITEHFYNGDEIVLVKSKIKSFTLGDDSFIHVNGKGMPAGLPEAGFYQVQYDGKSRVLTRHEKAMVDKIENTRVERYFDYKARYYVLKDGVYQKISGRKDLLKVFDDQKPALRAYASKEKFRISKSNPSSYARIAAYYDAITLQK
jgi:hypothetical protein